MSTDYAKKERDFLNGLKGDTGHTLEEWLKLIGAEKLEARNDIIDWLRQHGFTFSRASWLERIHHNGGQPIYAESGTAKARQTKVAPLSDAPEPNAATNKQTKPASKPQLRVIASEPKPSKTAKDATSDTNDIEATLARAKGLRPLAQHLLAEIKTSVQELEIAAIKSVLVLSAKTRPFGIIALTAKDLRLGLALAPDAPQSPFQSPQFVAGHARISEKITHMMVLDDVRQIDAKVLAHVKLAAERA